MKLELTKDDVLSWDAAECYIWLRDNGTPLVNWIRWPSPGEVAHVLMRFPGGRVYLGVGDDGDWSVAWGTDERLERSYVATAYWQAPSSPSSSVRFADILAINLVSQCMLRAEGTYTKDDWQRAVLLELKV